MSRSESSWLCSARARARALAHKPTVNNLTYVSNIWPYLKYKEWRLANLFAFVPLTVGLIKFFHANNYTCGEVIVFVLLNSKNIKKLPSCKS